MYYKEYKIEILVVTPNKKKLRKRSVLFTNRILKKYI